jgi:predicted small lipoprotein YifL
MPIRTLLIAALIACAVSGCGRRGALEETGVPETAPDQPSDPSAFGGFLPASEAPTPAPPRAPERGFILDPLL